MRAHAPTVYRALECQIVRETEKAVLVNFKGKAIWFPLSQTSSIEYGDPVMSATDIVMCSEWILREKGITFIASAPEKTSSPNNSKPDDDIPF